MENSRLTNDANGAAYGSARADFGTCFCLHQAAPACFAFRALAC
jgi:hypothetical protein